MKVDPSLSLIGRRISELRATAGYSQEGFAHEIGMDRAYFGGVERGQRNIAALNLLRIAQGLGVEVGELFPTLTDFKKPKAVKPVVKRGRPRQKK